MKKNSENKNKFNLKNNKKNITIISGIIILILIIILFLKLVVFTSNSFASIKYQVYTKNKGTSSFKKDGEIIETKNPIVGLKILISSKYDGVVYYDISNEFESKRCYNDDICNLEQKVEKISFNLTDTLKKKYDIYYKVYYGDKWSKWAHNSEEVGKKEKGITKIKIKLVPKNAYLGDYLEEYDDEVMNNEK